MSREHELLERIKQIRTLSQNGLVYATNEYETERYRELLQLSSEMTSLLTHTDLPLIIQSLRVEEDYVTPKVDIRAVVFNAQREILLVQEKADHKWALPGGWADVGFSPTEVAAKETFEETGLEVAPIRLLAAVDTRCHAYPPTLRYLYKLFILCKKKGGTFNDVFDIADKGFFAQSELPPLSEERVIREHIDFMFEYYDNPEKGTYTD